MPRIAISYRRDDSLDITGRIFDRLAGHFGREAVFRDIDSIPLGPIFVATSTGYSTRATSSWRSSGRDGSALTMNISVSQVRPTRCGLKSRPRCARTRR